MMPAAADSQREQSGRSRYPGTRPFSDTPEDQARFFGRTGESEQLYLRVLSVPLLVQFGTSGLGKTSLLQAGLFPRLRQKPFLPIMVRLNVEGDGLTAAVVRSMKLACEAEGLEFSPGDTGGLWEFLRTTTVWRDDLLLTPVLVFDQFEEVFTLRDAAFRAEVAEELGALASGIAPSRLRASPSAARPHVKIVISLREDYLGSLEEFSAAIPGLFHERLRLEPLGEAAARDAITCPAQMTAAAGEEPYGSPPFQFEREALDALVEFLKGKSGVIEPFQLQLLSAHAERIANDRAGGLGGQITLTLADFGGTRGFELVLQNFYRDTLRRVSPRSQRKRAEWLCEEGLLGAAGQRRPLEERQILDDFGLTTETLKALTQARVIVRERRLESVFYEISHDRLAESIHAGSRKKIPKKTKRLMWAAAIVALVTVGALFWWKATVEKERDKARNARDKAEGMLSFLLGEQFLGEVRDIGRSTLLQQVHDETQGIGVENPLNRGLVLRNDGDIKRVRGDLKTAVMRFEEALSVIESSSDDQGTKEAARTHARLGEGLDEQGHLAQALRHYTAAVDAWRRVASADESTTDDCTSFAESLVTLAYLKRRMGEEDLAAKDLEEGVRIAMTPLFGGETPNEPCGRKDDDAAPYPDSKAVDVLAQGAALRSYLEWSADDAIGAAALAHEASELKPRSISIRRNALFALTNRGNYSLAESPQGALDDYRRTLADFDELRRWDPENRLWQRDRAACLLLVVTATVACHTRESNTCHAPPTLVDAEAMSLEATATLRTLAHDDEGNLSLRKDLVWALQENASVLAAQKRQSERLAKLSEAEKVYLESNLDESDAQGQADFARLLSLKSEGWEAVEQPSNALDTLRSSIGRYSTLVAAHPANSLYMSELQGLRRREVDLLKKTKDRTGAITAAERDEARMKEAVQTVAARQEERLRRLVRLETEHQQRGRERFEQNDAHAAVGEFKAAAAAMREYIRIHPAGYQAYRNLRINYEWILAALQKLGDEKDRRAILRASMHAAQISAWLAPMGARKEMDSGLLEARFAFADFLRDQGEDKDALPLAQELVVVAERLTQGPAPKAADLASLGFAKCIVGNLRRNLSREGWEEAIRSGLIDVDRAVAITPGDVVLLRRVGGWRVYLAEQLDAEKERKDDALGEFSLALHVYRKAQQLQFDDQTQEAIDKLEKHLRPTASR